jgi:hypothetical protein
MDDMKPLVELMEATLSDVKESLTQADEPIRVHRLQGKAIVLKDFLELVEKASQILARGSHTAF